MDNEIWKDIRGYEGLYKISNKGRVKSSSNKSNHTHEIILKPCINGKGYEMVSLCKNSKTLSKRVHKLVAEAFIPNDMNLSHVNHKDENKLNNHSENLEWCDNKYNLRYSTSKKVIRIGDFGKTKVYNAIEDVRHEGFNPCHVSNCCNKKRNSHKGYKWRFLNIEEVMQ